MRLARLGSTTAALAVLTLASGAAATPTTYTDSASFLAAVLGPATTVDFDAVAAGTTVSSGGSIGGLTLTYSLGGVSLAVTDGTSFGAATVAASSTSSTNFLGTDDADHLQDGDTLTLSFASGKGIGLFVLTRDAMEDDDVTLTAGGATAELLASAVEQTLGDGSAVYFLGVLDPAGSIASAVVDYPSDGETNFLWNVDDVILVPEPAPMLSLLAGVAGLAGLARLRRANRTVSKPMATAGVKRLSKGAMTMRKGISMWMGWAFGGAFLIGAFLLPQGASAQRLSLAEINGKIACISSASNGGLLLLEGCNVQIVDGTGSTGGAPPHNGKGNLIVGYNEDLLSPTGKDRTGAHNLVVGPEHTFSSYGGLVAGWKSTVSARHASVSGGATNTASGIMASVSGGQFNTASGANASVSGGRLNEASGSGASASGGQFNTASGPVAAAFGGGGYTPTEGNEAAGNHSVVGGGVNNTIFAARGVLIGDNHTTAIVANTASIVTHSAAIATNTADVATSAGNIATHTTSIFTNSAAIGANAGGISTNTASIGANSAAIVTNTANVATSAGNIATHTTSIATHTTAIGANAGGIATNTASIGANSTATATNTADVATSAGNIATHTTSIATNTTAITANTAIATALDSDLACVSSASDADDLFFEGCNVHVRDGSGTTGGTSPHNGKGNLIVGYNEDDVFPTGKDRTGAHNLVVGPEHTFSSYGGLVAGLHNTVSAKHASVSGGHSNVASGYYASVSGGFANEASGIKASVSGGWDNTASGIESSVSGGAVNTASTWFASVSGGRYNTASGMATVAFGGGGATAAEGNEAAGDFSVVGGGAGNTISTAQMSLFGGADSSVFPNLACISSSSDADDLFFEGCNVHVRDGTGTTGGSPPHNGKGNLIVGYNEDLLSPTGKDRTGAHNLVVGPEHTFSSYGGLVAGRKNTVSARSASVSGGSDNTASAHEASVSGGQFNTASAQHASVSGGRTNEASSYYASVSGGRYNTASERYASVSGGGQNTASGIVASVSGGRINEASSYYASVSGGRDNVASERYASISGGRDNTASGYAASVSGGRYNEASGVQASISGGVSNTASSGSASVSGGRYNIAGGAGSTVSGGNGNTTYTSDAHVP